MKKRIKRIWSNLKMSTKFWIDYEMINYSAILFFLLIGLISSTIIIILDLNDPKFSWHDILVEAHGLIFDLLVFGLIWTVFEFFKNKKEKISAKKEEIDDLIQLKTDEARVGIISKMNSLYSMGVRKFYISGAYIKNGSLQEMDLTDSMMVLLNFENGSFVRSNLKNVNLTSSNLKNVYFTSASLENTQLTRSNLKKAKFTDTDFYCSDLSFCNFREAEFAENSYEKANFSGVKLNNALVDSLDWFEVLRSQNVIGVDELEKKYVISENPKKEGEESKVYIVKKRRKNPA